MDSLDGNFATALDLGFLEILYSIGNDLGFDPLVPIEAERYFLKLQAKVWKQGKADEKLEKEVRASFISLTSPPRWVQGAEWPFDAGEPMIFVGQIESHSTSIIGDKSFYLFTSKSTENTHVVIQ